MDGLEQQAQLPVLSGSAWNKVQYFCTVRQGGVSQANYAALNLADYVNDNPHCVAVNRARLNSLLPSEPVWLRQVHGIEVFDADAPTIAPANQVPTADAAVTTVAGRVLAIMTADCLPVVIADTGGRGLGVAHAGWRGLAAGVLERTLDALRGRLPQNSRWRAWIGPGIGQRYFEVGPEVYQAFVGVDPACAQFFTPSAVAGHWFANLAGLAQYRLKKAGVHTIEGGGWCTYGQDDLFYSYRRDPACGRMATVAWLAASE